MSVTLGFQKTVESEAPPRTAFTKRYDYDGSGNLIYEGFAVSRLNPLTSDSVWAIKKYTYAGGSLSLSQWASSGAAVNVWDNRAAGSYQ